MPSISFRTPAGYSVPAVTAAEMRDVDRIAVEEVGLKLLQMMENAGRALARCVCEVQGDADTVVVAAGNGGNGGGGMACARHLTNRGVPVEIILDRPPGALSGAAAHQHRILDEMGVPHAKGVDQLTRPDEPIVVDSLIGYGLEDEVRSPTDEYIEIINDHSDSIVSLDIPSGIDATSGEALGSAVEPDRTLTLALPKTGLTTVPGELLLADIGIPETVYERLGIEYTTPFEERDRVELVQ
jgi:NAD(P)H-hydrate epimerase